MRNWEQEQDRRSVMERSVDDLSKQMGALFCSELPSKSWSQQTADTERKLLSTAGSQQYQLQAVRFACLIAGRASAHHCSARPPSRRRLDAKNPIIIQSGEKNTVWRVYWNSELLLAGSFQERQEGGVMAECSHLAA